MLNTDLTPAAFYLSNPDNRVAENYAAGGEGYGFWIALAAPRVDLYGTRHCPSGTPFLSFVGNEASSQHLAGVISFSTLAARIDPCADSSPRKPGPRC